MIGKLIVTGSAVCLLAFADFSYEQTSQITGGAMQGMMKVAGVFSKSAREPMKQTILIKGDRMATITRGELIDVIDLNAETFTEIDLKKKTYAVTTFADMARAMEKAAADMRKQNKDQQAEMNFKADVKQTGATRNVSGFDTKQTIVTLTAEIEDKQENAKGAMNFVMDMWLAPKVAGYDEVQNFYKRFGEKVAAWNPWGGMVGAMMGGQSKGMSELVQEMSKLDGIPVYQIVKVGGVGQPGGAEMSQQQAAPEQQQAPAPNVGEAAQDAAVGGALGRLTKGRLGGFGGFGRRKKEPEQQPAPQQQPAQQSAAPASGASGGSLLEMTSELSGFSSAPIDGSKFEVPAGFKKVDSQKYKL